MKTTCPHCNKEGTLVYENDTLQSKEDRWVFLHSKERRTCSSFKFSELRTELQDEINVDAMIMTQEDFDKKYKLFVLEI